MVACTGGTAVLHVQDLESAVLQKRGQGPWWPVVGRGNRVGELLDPVPGEEPDEQVALWHEAVSQGRKRLRQVLGREVNEGVPGQDGPVGPCR